MWSEFTVTHFDYWFRYNGVVNDEYDLLIEVNLYGWGSDILRSITLVANRLLYNDNALYIIDVELLVH
jgi:hypothetical protein